MSDTVTIRCKHGAETDKAVQITDLDDGVVYWLPLSHVVARTRQADDRSLGTVTMTGWIARAKGIT